MDLHHTLTGEHDKSTVGAGKDHTVQHAKYVPPHFLRAAVAAITRRKVAKATDTPKLTFMKLGLKRDCTKIADFLTP